MYCINCGVKLADTEKKCPLCNTIVFHPEIKQEEVRPLYPNGHMPKVKMGSKAISGAIIILFLIPLIICLFADWHMNGVLDWFGYVAGALGVTYVTIALPFWFNNPNPVIFTPCSFLTVAIYVLYINWSTGGDWFFSFAFPIICGIAVIFSSVVTLLYYLRRGKLYIIGGAFIALGLLMPLMEFLMKHAFQLRIIGWSIYPLIGLFLLGGLLIYLAINRSAREILERKLFF